MRRRWRALRVFMRMQVPVGFILLATVGLCMSWPDLPQSTPPAAVARAPHIVYIDQTATVLDPTRIALPRDEALVSDGLQAGDFLIEAPQLIAFARLAIRPYVKPPTAPGPPASTDSLPWRAQNAIGAFTPAPQPGPLFATAAARPATPYRLDVAGSLAARELTVAEWPPEVAAKAPGRWSVTASLDIDENGRVENVFLEQAHTDPAVNQLLVNALYRATVSPAATPVHGRVTITHFPAARER